MRNVKWMLLLAAVLSMSCQAQSPLAEAEAACADLAVPARTVAACTQVLESEGLDEDRRGAALYYRGQAHDLLGHQGLASADFERLIQLQPRNAQGYGARGSMYARQREFDRAMADFERALALDPDDMYARMNHGSVLEQRTDYAGALEDYELAMALAPDHPAPLNGRCWLRAVLGQDLEGAVADCTKALAMAADPNVHNSRGFAYYRMQRYAEAVADYDAAIAGAPQVGSSWYMRGLARRALGDQAAQADIDRGLALEPGVAERYAGYGVARE